MRVCVCVILTSCQALSIIIFNFHCDPFEINVFQRYLLTQEVFAFLYLLLLFYFIILAGKLLAILSIGRHGHLETCLPVQGGVT